MKKVAIIKNGLDIGRIVLGSEDSEKCDFKLNFLDNAFELRLVKLFQKPCLLELAHPTHWEITYHKSMNNKPPCVHLKHKSKNQPNKYPAIEKQYITLDLKRLSEPAFITDFPIPLFKIVVPNSLPARQYKPNDKEHIVLDMENTNTIEVYLAHTSFDNEEFSKKWPSIFLNLMTQAIEFFATNDIAYLGQKMKYFIPSDGGVRTAAMGFPLGNNVQLYCNIFDSDNILINEKNIQVTFIENEFAVPLLGLSTMKFSPSEKLRCSYKIDLFERKTNYFSADEKKEWDKRFTEWSKQLDAEIACKKKGIGTFLKKS